MTHERNMRPIHTAACLIIGDEVLGGKTVDTNSAYFAKWCFSLGIVSGRRPEEGKPLGLLDVVTRHIGMGRHCWG
jgi:hypothetical protein